MQREIDFFSHFSYSFSSVDSLDKIKNQRSGPAENDHAAIATAAEVSDKSLNKWASDVLNEAAHTH